MDNRVIAADYIFLKDQILANYALEINREGIICSLIEVNIDIENCEYHKGLLCPGFINAHLHLELSHLKGAILPQTGMASFIEQVVKNRNTLQVNQQETAILNAIQEMQYNGTVAAIDISNTAISFSLKQNSSLLFLNCIEVLGLDQNRNAEILAKGQEIIEKYNELDCLIVPHAGYSVNPRLMEALMELYHQKYAKKLMPIHFLESQDEIDYFQSKGNIFELFQKWGLVFDPSSFDNVVDYILNYMKRDTKPMYVHCIEADKEVLQKLNTFTPKHYICFCPKSNLYIHNKLPNFKLFYWEDNTICIGTDSLASNDSLNLLEEAQLITEVQPDIKPEHLLKALTLNPAQAMGAPQLGYFKVGNKPGINLLQANPSNPKELFDPKNLKIISTLN